MGPQAAEEVLHRRRANGKVEDPVGPAQRLPPPASGRRLHDHRDPLTPSDAGAGETVARATDGGALSGA
jgi:hypothetical protein